MRSWCHHIEHRQKNRRLKHQSCIGASGSEACRWGRVLSLISHNASLSGPSWTGKSGPDLVQALCPPVPLKVEGLAPPLPSKAQRCPVSNVLFYILALGAGLLEDKSGILCCLQGFPQGTEHETQTYIKSYPVCKHHTPSASH